MPASTRSDEASCDPEENLAMMMTAAEFCDKGKKHADAVHLRMVPGGQGSGPGFSTLQVFTKGVLGGTDSPSPIVISAKNTIVGKLKLADSRSK